MRMFAPKSTKEWGYIRDLPVQSKTIMHLIDDDVQNYNKSRDKNKICIGLYHISF